MSFYELVDTISPIPLLQTYRIQISHFYVPQEPILSYFHSYGILYSHFSVLIGYSSVILHSYQILSCHFSNFFYFFKHFYPFDIHWSLVTHFLSYNLQSFIIFFRSIFFVSNLFKIKRNKIQESFFNWTKLYKTFKWGNNIFI